MKPTKHRALVLCAIGVLLSLTSMACGQAKKQTGVLGFSWYIAYDWFSPPNAWGADVVSGWIKENKNVDIEWVYPSGSGSHKLNLMIATKELPDVICIDRGARVESLIDAGMLLPLDPYLDLLPNFKKWAGKTNLDLLRHSDGKLYQLPNWYFSPDYSIGNGNSGWAVNSQIYKQLGSPILKTYQDLEAYLIRVKQAYPDVIPLEAGDSFQTITLVFRGMAEQLSDYMGNLLGTPKNGKFTKVFKDENVRATLVFINRLMRQELITQDGFTQTRDQVMEKLINGQVAVMATWDVGALITPANDNNKIDPLLYHIIWPPVAQGVDPNKVALSGYSTIGWNVNVFTTAAESKIRQILSFLDWATGEDGQRVLIYGPQGYFWDDKDEFGIPIYNQRYAKASQQDRNQARLYNWDWVGNASWVNMTKGVANDRLAPEERDGMIEFQTQILWKTVKNENEFTYNKPAPDSELGMTNTLIADYYDEAIASALFASDQMTLLKILDQAQAEMDQIGYDLFLQYHNREWQKKRAQLKKLSQ